MVYKIPQGVQGFPSWLMDYYYYNCFMFYGPLSGTTRVSWYQKKHSPTHLS